MSRSLRTLLQGSMDWPLRENSELARKRRPTMLLHRSVAGKGTFAGLPPLGGKRTRSLAHPFSHFPSQRFALQKNVLCKNRQAAVINFSAKATYFASVNLLLRSSFVGEFACSDSLRFPEERNEVTKHLPYPLLHHSLGKFIQPQPKKRLDSIFEPAPVRCHSVSLFPFSHKYPIYMPMSPEAAPTRMTGSG